MSDHQIEHDDPLQIHEEVQVGADVPVPQEIEERLADDPDKRRDADEEELAE
jgi:hypothetical protein